jgi:hypothetical protein
VRFWILSLTAYVVFCAILIADLWPSLRGGWPFARSGLVAPMLIATYTSALILGARLLPARRAAITTVWSFLLLGAVYGCTAWFLEARLYDAYAEWGLGPFYFVACLFTSTIAAVFVILGRRDART